MVFEFVVTSWSPCCQQTSDLGSGCSLRFRRMMRGVGGAPSLQKFANGLVPLLLLVPLGLGAAAEFLHWPAKDPEADGIATAAQRVEVLLANGQGVADRWGE